MTEVGNVYGQSLYELAKDEGLSREIGEQLTVLQKSFGEEPDFVRLLSNPSLSKPERCRILDTSFRGSGASLCSEFYENPDGKRLYLSLIHI